MRSVKRGIILDVAATAVLAALVGATPAYAESPWWHLTSGSRPAILRTGVAKDEVQEVAVSATGGSFALIEMARFEFRFFKWNSTHEEVQAGLEEIYGKGNVQVSGGPGDEEGTKPYVITFIGELADQRVEPINAALSGGFLECSKEGANEEEREKEEKEHPNCKREATLTEKTRGRPDGQIVVTADNLGDASANGETSLVTIDDKLPPGLKAVYIKGLAGGLGALERSGLACPARVPEGGSLTCTFAGTLPPFDQIEVEIGVVVQGASSAEANEASVSGGEARSASVRRPLAIGGESQFGVESYELTHEGEDGAPDTQAGSHPFQQTTTITLNQTLNHREEGEPVALVKDLNFKWPPGLVGNPTVLARCSTGRFLTIVQEGNEKVSACPPQTAVGVATVLVNLDNGFANPSRMEKFVAPVFNLEPSVGEPARFGFIVNGQVPVYIDPSVRTGGDYGITVSTHNLSQVAGFLSSEVTVWGVPGDPRHDSARGYGCLLAARGLPHGPCNPPGERHPPPFLSLPTSCTGPLQASVDADSWAHAGSFQSFPTSEPLPAMDGCNRLPFSAQIEVTPDGQAASTPTGLTTDVHVPQDESLNPTGLAEGDVKDITVALPEGLELNPAAADGLSSCSESQIGFTGVDPTGTDLFTSTEPSCPDASKIGDVTIRTPVLQNPLKGFVYLASPQNFSAPMQENPFESLVAMYVVAQDRESGVLVKLPGSVSLSETGQIIATFKNTPEVPFEDAELDFFGGDRAPLATPAHCGSYTADASFTPWSGNEPLDSTSPPFEITSGPHGSSCPNPLPFAPSLTSQTTSVQAGGFSPLTTTISREDGNQNVQTVQIHMPPGLSGILSGVKLCPEAQANAGTCGAESQIGETIVSVGLGGDPFSVTGGKVYLTEKYRGAAFGLSIVNSADAGPFHLGKVIVRAKIEVDPHTAQLTITTDPSAPYAIPHILDGIPLQIKHVNVNINRPGFTFNPTNCNPMRIIGIIGSVEGASSPVSVPFQVTNCAALKFTPKVVVTTAAKSSKANGLSLVFKIAYPKGAMGSQSWFNEAKFDLPKQLPARLTTIQKACLASEFESNPATCPPASLIGRAVVHTPVLPVPLTGPVYFVSHGGAKFPDAILLLKGYGVTVELVGETLINGKTGVTSATFRNTPDVPFESIEVTVPSGPFSEFGANLPAKGEGQLLQAEARDADLLQSPERRGDPRVHEDHRHGLRALPTQGWPQPTQTWSQGGQTQTLDRRASRQEQSGTPGPGSLTGRGWRGTVELSRVNVSESLRAWRR